MWYEQINIKKDSLMENIDNFYSKQLKKHIKIWLMCTDIFKILLKYHDIFILLIFTEIWNFMKFTQPLKYQ